MKIPLQEVLAKGTVGYGRRRGRAHGYGSHPVHIVFGSPRRQCAGSGICTAKELSHPGEARPKACCGGNDALAWVRVTKVGHLVFDFPALCPRLIQQYFYGDMFQMESDAELELSLRGMPVVFVLPKGTYAVSRRDSGIRITIPGIRKENTGVPENSVGGA